MTTEQAIEKIHFHLHHQYEDVPKRLLKTIESIINQTRTIVKKELVVQQINYERPNFDKIWQKICKEYQLDPAKAKKGRYYHNVCAKTYFIRYVLLNYENVKLTDLGSFLKTHHASVIYLRDQSKAECPIPPFYQKVRNPKNYPHISRRQLPIFPNFAEREQK